MQQELHHARSLILSVALGAAMGAAIGASTGHSDLWLMGGIVAYVAIWMVGGVWNNKPNSQRSKN